VQPSADPAAVSSRGWFITVTRRRLDAELVRRQLAASRAQATTLVTEGRVTVGGAPADKPARLVAPDEPVVVLGPPPRYVSRGGHKLEAALAAFPLDVTGARTLDAGASTGGFTDCLLQHGAAAVWAIDVGHGQLHPRLRADDRVTVREGCHVRDLRPADTAGPFDVVVADLSFISLASLAPVLTDLARPGGDLVVLVKPQFEAGRAEASRGRGVISDPAIWRRTVVEVAAAFEAAGAAPVGLIASPLRGGSGNAEFLLHLRRGGEPADLPLDEALACAGASG
jgi:23S rRNA (cytidine1920-2'-O)/16S rRNA (cytidine1409-2'-O)-methyltransferase